MTPEHLREIADRPHVPADAQEALYTAAARIEGRDRARVCEWERAMLELRANAYGQRSGFGILFGPLPRSYQTQQQRNSPFLPGSGTAWSGR